RRIQQPFAEIGQWQCHRLTAAGLLGGMDRQAGAATQTKPQQLDLPGICLLHSQWERAGDEGELARVDSVDVVARPTILEVAHAEAVSAVARDANAENSVRQTS